MSRILRFSPASLLPMLLVALAGCSTTEFQVGQNFDPAAFTGRVERGVTTKDDVRAWLGEPASTGVDVETSGQRFDEWTYYFGEGSLTRLSSTKLKTLQVKFDTKGIVQGYELSQSAP